MTASLLVYTEVLFAIIEEKKDFEPNVQFIEICVAGLVRTYIE